MERSPEDELFTALEAEYHDKEQDISHVLRELDTEYRRYYDLNFGHELPYDNLHVDITDSVAYDRFVEIGNQINDHSSLQWECIDYHPNPGDILSVKIEKDTLFYESYDQAEDEYEYHALYDHQNLIGEFCGLVSLMYVPEARVAILPDDGNSSIASIVHPLGLSLIFRNVVIDGIEDDDYHPHPQEFIFVPVHYSTSRLTQHG